MVAQQTTRTTFLNTLFFFQLIRKTKNGQIPTYRLPEAQLGQRKPYRLSALHFVTELKATPGKWKLLLIKHVQATAVTLTGTV
jgi:hypothetical protein